MAAYWEPKINDRIRLVLTYEKRVRPILWFQVKRDGSIYFGIRRNNPPVMKKGSKVVEGSTIRFNYSEGEIVDSIRARNNPRVSYHTSGEVHLAETVFPGMSMNSITKTELIVFLIFEHLTKAFSLTKQEKHDIAIPFKFEEDKPLMGPLYVSPSNIGSQRLRPIYFPKAVSQTNLFFGYSNLDGCQDFTLQVALYNVAGGPWPPYSYIIMREERSLDIVGKA
jgi:hypothetical protein